MASARVLLILLVVGAPLLAAPVWGQAEVKATLETPPAFGDAAGRNADSDDPAIWIHPTDKSKSLIITSKKEAGVAVFDLQGVLVQDIPAPPPPRTGDRPGRINNVDIVYGVQLGSETLDIIVGSDRGLDKLKIWKINLSGTPLTEITDASAGFIFNANQNEVNVQATCYGVAAYKKADGTVVVYCTRRSRVRLGQLELVPFPATGTFGYRKVADLDVPSVFALPDGTTWTPCEDPGEEAQFEGMVVDPYAGYLYAGQEDVGIWRIGLDFAAAPTPVLFAKTREFGVPYTYDTEEEECVYDFTKDPGFGGQNLEADVEGLTIYFSQANSDGGYLLASSQGDDTFAVYSRLNNNRFIGSFKVVNNPDNGVDSIQDCDGGQVINVPLPGFPLGLLVAQDGDNKPDVLDGDGETRDNTNFKYIQWSGIASALGLVVDTTSYDPRLGFVSAASPAPASTTPAPTTAAPTTPGPTTPAPTTGATPAQAATYGPEFVCPVNTNPCFNDV
ncbi:3-phytase, partial [Klebsormidium nitens]